MKQKEQVQFFHTIFDPSLPRLGPGDHISTKRALNSWLFATSHKDASIEELRVLDLGCGNGTQTIQLAQALNATILAVDNYEPYLTESQLRARAAGVDAKIQPLIRDMCNLSLKSGSFDLIWSEGAIFILGFRRGLEICHDLLKQRGGLVISELTWFRTDVPLECRDYFAEIYPLLDDSAHVRLAEECGFRVLDHFPEPESAWLENYYDPIEKRLQHLETNCLNVDQMEMIEKVRKEIDMYRKYSSYYGYMFYVLERR